MLSRKYFVAITVLTFATTVLSDDTQSDQQYVTVKTESGEVRGYTEFTLLEKRQYYAFKGIPYAKPTVGPLKFKAPQKVDSWPGVLNATEYGHSCLQIIPDTTLLTGEEDCLTLNIFTPNVNPTEKLPVIFYIHGGGLVYGGSIVQGPGFLLEEDVIFVTINYRLGPFGFMSLGTPDYPGNAGFKDQLLALKWVNDNIHHFGGDRNMITLHGHSSGSESVNFHILSPASRGLFRRAIGGSGSAMNPWAFTSKNHTKIVREWMEKPNASVDEIIEWLNTADREQFLKSAYSPPDKREKSIKTTWSAVIENQEWENGFLTKSPGRYYREEPSDVDIMFGFSESETIGMQYEDLNNPDSLKPFDEHFELQLPLIGLNYSFDSDKYRVYKEEIRNFYFGNQSIDKDHLTEYIRLMDDVFFIYGIDQIIKAQARRSTGRTYYYEFATVLGLNAFRDYANATALGFKGATHVEDMLYLFNTKIWAPENLYDGLRLDSPEARFIKFLRTFVLNFVKSGNPTPNDKPAAVRPIEGDVINYVRIEADRLVPGVSPRRQSIQFWDEFFAKHPEVFDVEWL
ncbi:esterase E4-like isoform X1 [Bradysia coprophila]|uniref:esterase E4-like isoform X1 n=1 Tax=Bradysia coprophila TaxID=38358 RepID=UPI00187DADF8|nr:esterase E4-like isoform X1 [Bradysia coprophila]